MNKILSVLFDTLMGNPMSCYLDDTLGFVSIIRTLLLSHKVVQIHTVVEREDKREVVTQTLLFFTSYVHGE